MCGEGLDDGAGRDGRGHERWVVPLLCLFKKKVRGDVEGREAESTIKRLQDPNPSSPSFSCVKSNSMMYVTVERRSESVD